VGVDEVFSLLVGSDSKVFDCVGVCGAVTHSIESSVDKDDVDSDLVAVSSFDELSLLIVSSD
jgi:hypothetical protein